jgi:hypothetical protein
MRNLAGNVLQVMSPRAADNDGVIQRKGTGNESSSRITAPSASLRTQLAILYYTSIPEAGRVTGSVLKSASMGTHLYSGLAPIFETTG